MSESPALHEMASRVDRAVNLVSGSVAVLLPLVLPDELVPVQLESVPAAAALLGLIAFMLGSHFASGLARIRGIVVVGTALSAIGLLVLNLSLVKVLPQVGDPPTDRRVLVGLKVTEHGDSMFARVGASEVSLEQQLTRVGGEVSVPLVYGRSYTVAKVLYAVAMILTFVGVSAYLASPVPSPD